MIHVLQIENVIMMFNYYLFMTLYVVNLMPGKSKKLTFDNFWSLQIIIAFDLICKYLH